MDYFSRWVLEKRKEISLNLNQAAAHGVKDLNVTLEYDKIGTVESIIAHVPPHVMSQRSIECRMYARALFYWERHIRQRRDELKAEQNTPDESVLNDLNEKLLDIYAQIDEPDGIEGIAAQLQMLTSDQQMLEDCKTGRWTAVQSWAETELQNEPDNDAAQLNLLISLRESGQHDVLLNHIVSFGAHYKASQSLPFAAEACWATSNWTRLDQLLSEIPVSKVRDFNVGVGKALLALASNDSSAFQTAVGRQRTEIMRGLSARPISSLASCHDHLLRLQALSDLEAVSGSETSKSLDGGDLFMILRQRMSVVGAYSSNKQYLLGLRRAAMELSQLAIPDSELSSSWLESAKIARKSGFIHQAYIAVRRASKLGDEAAIVERARLLWQEGYHRKAIQSLEGALTADTYRPGSSAVRTEILTRSIGSQTRAQSPAAAQANLLLAKWLDRTGQTSSGAIIEQYQQAVKLDTRSEKGHYHLGRHYNKLLESESMKEAFKQSESYHAGETAKLVIENYLRSLHFGSKYMLQTLPRVLTLWLQLGENVVRAQNQDRHLGGKDYVAHIQQKRQKEFTKVMNAMKKATRNLPAYVFYTVLSQIIARIVGCNRDIQDSLITIVGKVCATHPQQALWSLLTLVQSSDMRRQSAGKKCIEKTRVFASSLSKTHEQDIVKLIHSGASLSEQLLKVCNAKVRDDRKAQYSLSNDLGLSHAKAAPCRLAIPLEATLQPSLPTQTDRVGSHQAFSKNTVTIANFLDEAVVLSSLIRPRKVKIRGSDGNNYSLLCKPKDDLRKDQRLLEFNSMIGRLLKKDADCSKRGLYIRTYAVTPLNEDCGLIEWVDGLRTLRDILIEFLKRKRISVDWGDIRAYLQSIDNRRSLPKFTKDICGKFPLVFHEWFIEMFPEPQAWFAARLRWTRSCAVMSFVGHVLGLGDRHGENILVEEAAGGAFHVDFNCLFDKGTTFECPERVPFRLTRNMVDAMGACGAEGPFRKAAELTAQILRQHEHTLMTALYPFVHDPTVDQKDAKKPPAWGDVHAVLEKVKMKVRGLLPNETLPLSVEGYVDLQIKEAMDQWNLARMYIGWAPFF